MATISRYLFGSLLFLLIGLISQDATKQSPSKAAKDPCDSALSQMDMNKCYDKQYRKTDARLNDVYRKVMDSLEQDLTDAQNKQDEEHRKYVETAIQKLRTTEKAWITYRNLNCDAAEFEVWKGSMSPMVWAGCMTTVTEHRILELKNVYGTTGRLTE